jgi:hypothetical protein
MDKEITRLDNALQSERELRNAERLKSETDHREMEATVCEQGKAIARVQELLERTREALKTTRDLLSLAQAHILQREQVVRIQFPDGRPDWLLPVPMEILTPVDEIPGMDPLAD